MKAYLGLGSNLGDREEYINLALKKIEKIEGTTITKASSIYETEPTGGVPHGKFLNGAAEIETNLEPGDLLLAVKMLERSLGRVEGVRLGPRTIDIDILLYGDLVIDREELKIPHPRMHERLFVLKPLAEIAPFAIHPILKKDIQTLCNESDKTHCPDVVLFKAATCAR